MIDKIFSLTRPFVLVMVLIMGITIIPISSAGEMLKASPQDPHFDVVPQVISKALLGKTGIIILRMAVDFSASGLADKPVTAYITIQGGASSNTVCINGGDIFTDPVTISPLLFYHRMARSKLIV